MIVFLKLIDFLKLINPLRRVFYFHFLNIKNASYSVIKLCIQITGDVMSVLIGGEKAYLQRIAGDIVISYQWVNQEPAMIIWPKIKRLATKGAYVIPIDSAYKYADMDYLVEAAAKAAEFIGMDESRFTIHRIATAILDGLPDLLEMPPEPNGLNKLQNEQIGEAKIIVDGRTILDTELTVPEGLQA